MTLEWLHASAGVCFCIWEVQSLMHTAQLNFSLLISYVSLLYCHHHHLICQIKKTVQHEEHRE